MHAWRHTPGGPGGISLGLLPCGCACQTAAAGTIQPSHLEPAAQEPVYFLVGEVPTRQSRHDAYVLPLTDPQHIAHARRLVAEGPSAGRTIPVASIAKGADGINGDWKSPATRLWSWHVVECQGFHDITAEILDGSPTLVEGIVDDWIDNTGGAIGFWAYTVVRELPAFPPLPGDANLDGSVNGTDFALLASNFGRPSEPDWGRGDFNHDGEVSGADFALLAGNFGRSAPGALSGGQLLETAAVVPEPSSLWVLALATPLLRRRRVTPKLQSPPGVLKV